MKIVEIIHALEQLAPLSLQESYDNAGLVTGELSMEISGILVCLDCTEAVIDEAIATGCNMIVSHHPVVFSGIKKITGNNYVERILLKAIRNHIALYASHTNLDNTSAGVNKYIADKLGLTDTRVLSPLSGRLRKLCTFVPADHAEQVRGALFKAGAGSIGYYDECSFSVTGEGTFRPLEGSEPFTGKQGIRNTEKEVRIEVIYNDWQEGKLLSSLRAAHPYEEPAIDLIPLLNAHAGFGAGMIGVLPVPLQTEEFLEMLAVKMNTECIRHTAPATATVREIAVCGGSGSFLLPEAIRSGADVFVTGDFKYHQFFDADKKIMIADIGHFESEQFTINLLGDYLREKFTNFAVRLTEVNTNPIKYFLK